MIVTPDINNEKLTRKVFGRDENGKQISLQIITERAITVFLNAQEVVTIMTIGDQPEFLAHGYLLNQNILQPSDKIDSIDFDDELGVVVVRTNSKTNFETKQKKKIKTSGCGQGTIFADVIDAFENCQLSTTTKLHVSHLPNLLKTINTTPSLYLNAGAIHGCVLCKGVSVSLRPKPKEIVPLVYMEDVGRHNAVDKIAGWMAQNNETGEDKIFYTTGRLTSEMIIKTVMMKIPILISRSGFTAWGVELARRANLTLIGRARGARFIVLAGDERVVYDEPNESFVK